MELWKEGNYNMEMYSILNAYCNLMNISKSANEGISGIAQVHNNYIFYDN